jgi:hypothetical protein
MIGKREELEDGALAVVTCAPEADSIFDAPWVTEWQKKFLGGK